MVEFDGNDWLQNEPNSIPTSLRNSGYSVLAICRYTEGVNGRVITSTSTNSRNWDNWLMGLHGGNMGRYYFLGWVDQGFNKDYNFHLFEVVHEGWNKSSDPTAYVWNDAIPGNYYKGSPNGSNNTWFTPLNISLGGWTRQNSQLEFSNCQVGELLLFDEELEESERLLLEGYLCQNGEFPCLLHTHGRRQHPFWSNCFRWYYSCRIYWTNQCSNCGKLGTSQPSSVHRFPYRTIDQSRPRNSQTW